MWVRRKLYKNKIKGGRRKSTRIKHRRKTEKMEDKMYLHFVCNFRIYIGQIVFAPQNSIMSDRCAKKG
jgi:hypothetical protein